MKYRSIKTPPVTGILSLKDAEKAARSVSSNGTHLQEGAKIGTLRSGTVRFHKSVAGSALTQSHSRSLGTASKSRSLAVGQRGTTKSVSARKK